MRAEGRRKGSQADESRTQSIIKVNQKLRFSHFNSGKKKKENKTNDNRISEFISSSSNRIKPLSERVCTPARISGLVIMGDWGTKRVLH